MTNEMISVIVVGFVLAVSTGVLVWGLKKRNITKISLGGMLLLFGFFVLFDRFPKYTQTFNAWATLLLAVGAFTSVAVSIWLYDRRTSQEHRVRQEDRELAAIRRHLDEVHNWINEVSKLVSGCVGALRTTADRRQRMWLAKQLVSATTYVNIEAGRLDSKFASDNKLVDIIKRLSWILEHEDIEKLGADKWQQEIPEKCEKALQALSNINASLGL